MVLADVLRLFYYERLTGKFDEQDGMVFGRFSGADHRHRYSGDDSPGLISDTIRGTNAQKNSRRVHAGYCLATLRHQVGMQAVFAKMYPDQIAFN